MGLPLDVRCTWVRLRIDHRISMGLPWDFGQTTYVVTTGLPWDFNGTCAFVGVPWVLSSAFCRDFMGRPWNFHDSRMGNQWDSRRTSRGLPWGCHGTWASVELPSCFRGASMILPWNLGGDKRRLSNFYLMAALGQESAQPSSQTLVPLGLGPPKWLVLLNH